MFSSREAVIGAAIVLGLLTVIAVIASCLRMARRSEDQAERDLREITIGKKDQYVGERITRLREIQANDPAVKRLAERREEERRASARLSRGF